MKPTNRQLLVCLLLLLAAVSCKKDKDKPDPGPDFSSEFNLRDVQVVLPAGSTHDLSNDQLMSFGERFPVAKDGKTKAVDPRPAEHIAYLFDKDGDPIMAGFIIDSTTTISTESTA